MPDPLTSLVLHCQRGGDYTGPSLRGADLAGINLRDKCTGTLDLAGANFDGASLYQCDFRGSDLSSVSFRGANLGYAQLGWCTLDGVDWFRANLHRVLLPHEPSYGGWGNALVRGVVERHRLLMFCGRTLYLPEKTSSDQWYVMLMEDHVFWSCSMSPAGAGDALALIEHANAHACNRELVEFVAIAGDAVYRRHRLRGKIEELRQALNSWPVDDWACGVRGVDSRKVDRLREAYRAHRTDRVLADPCSILETA